MDSFWASPIVSAMRYFFDTTSRCEVAPGGIRSGAISRGELLPLMVRSNRLLDLKLSLRLVGTNVRNSASVWHFSSQRPRCQVHLVGCSLYVKYVTSWELPPIWLSERPQSPRWTASAGNLAGRGSLFWKVLPRSLQGSFRSGSFRTSPTMPSSSPRLSEPLSSVGCRAMTSIARQGTNSR